jgi:hypothetical protein
VLRLRRDPPGVRGGEPPARDLEIVVRLQVQPELRAVAEVQAKAQHGVGVIRRRLPTISAIRFGEMPIAWASRFYDSPYSFRDSSRSISPGVTGASSSSVMTDSQLKAS